jgi:hypothetical protein
MIIDYDFALGKARLRGTGGRGLAALAMMLGVRSAVAIIIVIYAKPLAAWVMQLALRLLGG